MRQIVDSSLWIGNARDARDIRAVLGSGIEAIVELAATSESVTPMRELVYLRYPLMDGEGNSSWLIRGAVYSTRELARHDVSTLVACDGGMSRSVVIATAALWFQVMGVPPDELLRRVARGGPADVPPALWEDVKRCVFEVT